MSLSGTKGAAFKNGGVAAGSDPIPAPASTKLPAKRSRQNPGPACQQCRIKKLRCDRRTPCGCCAGAGVRCHVDTTPPQRGPKKGYLKALRSRIAALESRVGTTGDMGEHCLDLDLDLDDNDLDGDSAGHSPTSDHQRAVSPTADALLTEVFHQPMLADIPPMIPPWTHPADPAGLNDNSPLMGLRPVPGPVPPPVDVSQATITPLMQADLDQLYFDRVHMFVPMLHRARYVRRSRDQQHCRPPASESHACLQQAMWTLAATLSSQFQQLRGRLYLETLQRLRALELVDSFHHRGGGAEAEAHQLEQVQAWILVAIYEFMQVGFHRAWASAGRAIRLVQLMRLHDLDPPFDASSSGGEHLEQQHWPPPPPYDADDAADAHACLEEKRRTFWMAFCLDRYSCVIDGLPLTLGEHIISTRLPCREDAFQSGVRTQMPTLAEVMDMSGGDDGGGWGQGLIHHLVQCIIFTTLWGRVVAHLGQSTRCKGVSPTHTSQAPTEAGGIGAVIVVSTASPAPSSVSASSVASSSADFCTRQLQLDQTLGLCMLRLRRSWPPESIRMDPVLHFTSMIAHVSVLSLCKAADRIPATLGPPEYQEMVASYQSRGPAAAREMARLSRDLDHFGLFKIHPFTPIPLSVCRQSLIDLRGRDFSVEDDIRAIEEALHELNGINSMGQGIPASDLTQWPEPLTADDFAFDHSLMLHV
ncbi:hypothetical protein MAPG_11842 [Magnaporthiopsis poae ATCC 64411]|uniref:Zn(2)-C6 fungal-type domain-containing protein n=1 Tax=Magnaporthiopsis poae (strain ATCC 64411 / 73-15) TaxID=644358 RepID=A0A0C4EGB1_MAGP6|nr:hypothetical protein MAPG_11842 [Magnaporthiopsis poae ATCC 64411]